MKEHPLERLGRELGLGATGKFPHGKFSPNDEGELKAAVSIEDGDIVILFGKNLSWLRMVPDEARAWANILLKKADEAEGKNSEN